MFSGRRLGRWLWLLGLGWMGALTPWLREWLAPPVGDPLLLWVSVGLPVALCWWLTRASPRPSRWSRFWVLAIFLVLAGRYLLWRVLATLRWESPGLALFSLAVLGLEVLGSAGGWIQLVLMVQTRDRRPEADLYSLAVMEGRYRPSVDILIPTYNEPAFILKRTILGCQALDYEPKTIYLLDDTRRPEIRALAQALGCEYITRPDNRHAKAGNLNHALALTRGELIAVFDADFVPTRNFLTRTVGFFQNPRVALVQTPQTFYNPDPIAYNLGLTAVLTPEEEVFYRQVEPMRDGVQGVTCSGTSFVVRRAPLEAIGGFVTDSLCEDYFTGIRLSALGYEVVYLAEKLSAGLAAETIAAHIQQRLRWARGTVQGLFLDCNPLTIPGLNWQQRLAHLEGLLHWFSCWARLGFLLLPLPVMLGNVLPLQATAVEVVYYFLPYYLAQFIVWPWLNGRSRAAVVSDLYALVTCWPVSRTVLATLLRPFGPGFRVTPKGLSYDRPVVHWPLLAPLLLCWGLNVAGLVWVITTQGWRWLWLWSGYNLLMLSLACLALVDAPRPSPYPWFALRQLVRFQQGTTTAWGVSEYLSETGACVGLTQGRLLAGPTTVDLPEVGLTLTAHLEPLDNGRVHLTWTDLTLDQERQLIPLLFCRPGQWLEMQVPGEWQSLGWLLRALVRGIGRGHRPQSLGRYGDVAPAGNHSGDIGFPASPTPFEKNAGRIAHNSDNES
ncbi:MAG: glycosyltransferase [Gloeomargarita sp. SKYBB_i_bin120]|nr:glycosyltransferase [Gloeomargarita sp. SKYG98]MCS7292800.1 glycosyltransferase [Gloeomargarita sp. SKYB120]MDW8178363.1 glycosyltransferase [Gloeomargarita sp. SKYBB_i_bin120]